MAKPRYRHIPISELEPPSKDIRTTMGEDELNDLVESIKRYGVLQPIGVRKRYDKFEVVWGYRRVRAAIMAGLATIPALVIEADDAKSDFLKLHENVMREDMNPIDTARVLSRMIKEYGLSHGQVAKMLNRSDAWVSQHLRLLSAPKELVEAVEDGKMSFTVARELVQIDDEDEVKYLTHQAVESGCSPKTAKAWKEDWKKKTNPPPPVYVPPEAVNPPPTPPPVYFPCPCCRRQYELNDLVLLRLCVDCRSLIEEVASKGHFLPSTEETE